MRSICGDSLVLPAVSEIRGDSSPAHMLAAFRQLLPDGIVVEGGDLKPADRDLPLDEELALGNVVRVRRREFRAGRIYARQALRNLGFPEAEIPIGPERVPVWPTGIVGSISHTRSLCAVAVGMSADYLGLGIDIEEDSPLSDELVSVIARVAELDQREAIEDYLGCDLPKLLFVIKEAFYKMHFPLHRRFLTFQDVHIELDVERHAAIAVIDPSSRWATARTGLFEGRFGRSPGTLFSCFHVSAR